MKKDLAVLAWLVNGLLSCMVSVGRKTKPFHRKQRYLSLASIGADSLPIVTIIAACTGMILALQSAQQLEKVGALSYVANLVGVSILTELGPLLTAIIITGRSGAAFAAEIATMQISEEIDALEVMGLEPVRFLVWPKFMSMVVMLPILTLWADVVGVTSGGVFSSLFLGISGQTYFEQSVDFLKLRYLYTGLVKSLGFAVVIAVIGCWQGFLAREGAADVGRKTTRAVVQTIFAIILLDLFFTTLNFMFR